MKNNIIKSLFGLLVMAGMALSCVPRENYLYQLTNDCVTFEKGAVSFSFTKDSEPIVLNMVRGVADKELTVNLVFEQDEANVFSISATSVNFPAGEYKASVNVTYDFEQVPAGKHNFQVSFDKSMVSPAGTNVVTAAATKSGVKPVGEWMDYATVQFWHKKLNPSLALHDEEYSLLQVSYADNTNYRIRNIANSGIDLYINVPAGDDPDDGPFTVTGPEPVDCPYEEGSKYIKIPTSIMYEGEPVTLWLDQTPKYLHVYDNGCAHGDEYSMSMGDDWYTEIKAYVLATTESRGILTWPEPGSDDDGWWSLYYDVVDFNPQEDAKYTDYATVQFWHKKLNSSLSLHEEEYSVLQVSIEDKNEYRIKNIANSGIDLKINVPAGDDPDDGPFTVTGPEPVDCPYEEGSKYIKIPTSIMYEGEPVTLWLDQTPKYLHVYDNGCAHGAEYSMSMGDDWYTEIKAYVLATTESRGVLTWPEPGSDDDGWWSLYYDVVDFNPQEDAKYMDYATVQFWHKKLNPSLALHEEEYSLLQVSLEDKNEYRIKNIANSGIDLKINVPAGDDPDDGPFTVTGPEPVDCPYEEGSKYIKIPTSIMYEGEPVTLWLDQTPKYLHVYDNGCAHGAEYSMSMGDDWYTEIKAYVLATTESKGILTWPEDGSDDDGWWSLYYDVVSLK